MVLINTNMLSDGSIALHWAVVNNKIEVVRYLLASGADPLEKTSRSVNALHLASGLGTYR
jgi:ankyrin repeat protein